MKSITKLITKSTMKSIIKSFVLSCFLASVVHGQDVIPKAAPQRKPIVIRDTTIHTVAAGVVEGSIVFDGGKITAVVPKGRVLDVPGVEVIDGRGRHVYPGFVCAASVMGLTEVGSVDMTLDSREAGTLKPEVFAAVAHNVDSWIIPVTRRNGILTCGVFPRGGLVAGRASVVGMDAWTWEQAAIEPDAGLVINWPFTGRRRGDRSNSDRLELLDRLFDQTRTYLAAKVSDPTTPTDVRLDAMVPVVEGRKPVFVNAATKSQIESAVLWTRKRGVRCVIVGGRDALHCVDLLRKHDIMVAVTAAHRLPHRRDLSPATTYELPRRLEEAGIRWCLTMSPFGASNVRNLPYEAAACVAYGLSKSIALRSITLSAAECLGVGDRLGSLEVGKLATLFIADGDPLRLTTKISAAFIEGRRIRLEDKQTQLAEKYRMKYRQLEGR